MSVIRVRRIGAYRYLKCTKLSAESGVLVEKREVVLEETVDFK